MKEIKAIVQPFMLEKILSALEAMDELPGVTVSEVLGWGRARGRARGAGLPEPIREAGHAFAKKAKLEIVVPDGVAPRVVEAIRKNACTGRAGDGKIFVSEVTEVVKVRTGETGEGAL